MVTRPGAPEPGLITDGGSEFVDLEAGQESGVYSDESDNFSTLSAKQRARERRERRLERGGDLSDGCDCWVCLGVLIACVLGVLLGICKVMCDTYCGSDKSA